jgi:hypothetical protein
MLEFHAQKILRRRDDVVTEPTKLGRALFLDWTISGCAMDMFASKTRSKMTTILHGVLVLFVGRVRRLTLIPKVLSQVSTNNLDYL